METRNSVEDLALLPLPDLSTLSEKQRRGALCVWDSTPLGPDATDLGQRQADDGRTIFPRSCCPCMRAHVRGSAAAHKAMCEQCVDGHADCETDQALQRLVREHGR